ncbi:MAG: endo-1,4-beta-xylanase, partial [Planctomycetota bacterium]
IAGGSPVYGQFNAVSLERRTAWPVLQPEAGVAMDALAIDRLIEASLAVVRHVRFGAVVSADTAELPGWVVEAPPGDFAQMVEAHARALAAAWGGKTVGLDVYADALTHQAVEDRIGVAGVRRLFQAAGFAQPEARLNLRLDDGLTVGRITAVARRVDALTGRLVPIGGLTLTQRVDGVLQQEGVRRSLERAAALGLPVTIAELEVSGASPIAAAVNLETLLRHAFATPGIEGVYFRGVEAGELVSARAALVDGGGEATPAGKVLEGLFGAVWRSRVEARADEVGNVRARVFAGRYLAEVQLPDGTACTARFHVPLSRETVAVVVQPMRHQAEAGVGQRGEAAAPTR